jgi:hypothetical protein
MDLFFKKIKFNNILTHKFPKASHQLPHKISLLPISHGTGRHSWVMVVEVGVFLMVLEDTAGLWWWRVVYFSWYWGTQLGYGGRGWCDLIKQIKFDNSKKNKKKNNENTTTSRTQQEMRRRYLNPFPTTP